MVTIELWGGQWDGQKVAIPELVERLHVHERVDGEEFMAWYKLSGWIKHGRYVYELQHAS